jgi:hypothetical protein
MTNFSELRDRNGPVDDPGTIAADPLSRLHYELKQAIAQENYELAAKLRDAIRQQTQKPLDGHRPAIVACRGRCAC